MDRLAWRAHVFHRFAHHPLCAEYESEVIRIGHKLRVCRGCTLTLFGAIVGITTALFLRRSSLQHWLLVAMIGGMIVGISLGLAFRWRLSKWFTRFLPAAVAAWVIVSGFWLGSESSIGMALTAVLVGLFAVFRYRRRGPWRRPCEGCLERDQRPACRGTREILRRERAFSRLAGSWIRNG